MKTDLTLSVDRLREVLDYDPKTGVFRWRGDMFNGHRAGDVAGCPAGTAKRLQIMVDDVARYAHRMAWAYVHGVWPDGQIDHRNGNKQDNRLSNLREATNAQNKQNMHGSYRNNVSGRLGVGQDKRSGRWRARIMVGGVSKNLGTFDTGEQATAAYFDAKRELHTFWAA